MTYPISDDEVHDMSAATATYYARHLVKYEAAESGTKETAIAKIARDYGLTTSQVTHLYKGRAKTCDVGLFAKIRFAYLDHCARVVAALQHQLMIEGIGGDDAVADLAARAAALAAEVEAQRASINKGKKVK